MSDVQPSPSRSRPASQEYGQPALPTRRAGLLGAILRQRCPRCRTGRMFRGSFTMNDPCPVCGLIFEREEGYFLGAMYISYGLALGFLVPFFFLATVLLPGWSGIVVALVAVVPYLPLMPLVFRYSRVLWIYYDRYICPSDLSAGAYEKSRRTNQGDGHRHKEGTTG